MNYKTSVNAMTAVEARKELKELRIENEKLSKQKVMAYSKVRRYTTLVKKLTKQHRSSE